MLSKLASLSINVVTTIFNTDCANPSNFSSRFVCIYSMWLLWSLKIQRRLPPFVPSELNWDVAGLCIFLYEGHENVCFVTVSFHPRISLLQVSENNSVNWNEFSCMNEDPLFHWWFPGSIIAHLYILYSLKRFALWPRKWTRGEIWEQKILGSRCSDTVNTKAK